jgi:hypothetical protein
LVRGSVDSPCGVAAWIVVAIDAVADPAFDPVVNSVSDPVQGFDIWGRILRGLPPTNLARSDIRVARQNG